LIIFDLDDTLIDTSGSVTPFKMRECLKRLVEGGLAIQDFSRSYKELLEINARSAKSKEAILSFLDSAGGDPALAPLALQQLTAPLPDNFTIPLTPNAYEILSYYKKSHTLCLVTGGHPPFQREKLKKAGLEPSFFSKIAIPEDSIKGPHLEALSKEFSTPPSEIWVCGDRIEMDLAPAHKLGFHTIHMRWGRGKIAKTEQWIEHSISDLGELKRIIQ
jgi:FMN phosphatase YigB (HAD superfamily)